MTNRFYTLEELNDLSLEDLQALWDAVPTERQRSYKHAYEREVRNAGALGSDKLEQQVADELLRRYEDSALVPIGKRWARTPSRVQEAAKSDDPLETGDGSTEVDSKKPSPLLMIAGAMIALLFVGFFLLNGRGGEEPLTIAEATEEVGITPTPMATVTPTPLALEAQDDIIEGGDEENELAYPVSLQMRLPDGSPPRVFVVQRRAVRASEWNYDPNPDIASFVNNLRVRPVMGIPFSEENAMLFEQMEIGTIFTVTMNTGATVRYEFAERSQVRRSDTDIFRQVSPGLVLLLIGERDEEGLPTATRTLITATYPPEQELARDGALTGLTLPDLQPMPTATPAPQDDFADVDVQLLSATTQPGRLTTRFRVYNGGTEAVQITGEDIQLASGYVPNPAGPSVPAENVGSLTLLPQQAIDITLIWYWAGEPYGSLEIGDHLYQLDVE